MERKKEVIEKMGTLEKEIELCRGKTDAELVEMHKAVHRLWTFFYGDHLDINSKNIISEAYKLTDKAIVTVMQERGLKNLGTL